jgi:hypothetical protein
MSAGIRQIVTFYTTPRELRDMADRMECHWRDAATGRSLVSDRRFGNGFEIEFCIDQTEIGKVRV